jgi:hypothetical protein
MMSLILWYQNLFNSVYLRLRKTTGQVRHHSTYRHHEERPTKRTTNPNVFTHLADETCVWLGGEGINDASFLRCSRDNSLQRCNLEVVDQDNRCFMFLICSYEINYSSKRKGSWRSGRVGRLRSRKIFELTVLWTHDEHGSKTWEEVPKWDIIMWVSGQVRADWSAPNLSLSSATTTTARSITFYIC